MAIDFLIGKREAGMLMNRRIVASITAFFFFVSELTGCSTLEPRRYSEDGVTFIAVHPGSNVQIDSGSVAVVGRIRVENKQGTPLDASKELAVYILRDVSPNAPIPDWHLAELVRLNTKPFAPEKDASFRLVLPKGRYYLQLAYRSNDFGLVSINPRARIDIDNPASPVAYVGTLVVTIDIGRVNEAYKAATVSYSEAAGALAVSLKNDFPEDGQYLLSAIPDWRDLPVEQNLFALDTLKQPDLSFGKKEKSGVFNENLSAGEIILYSAALLVIVPLWVILAALGGGAGGK